MGPAREKEDEKVDRHTARRSRWEAPEVGTAAADVLPPSQVTQAEEEDEAARKRGNCSASPDHAGEDYVAVDEEEVEADGQADGEAEAGEAEEEEEEDNDLAELLDEMPEIIEDAF